MYKVMLLNFFSDFLSHFFEIGIIHILIYFIGIVLPIIYHRWLLNKIRQLLKWINKLLGNDVFKRYKIDDLVFEYYPIFNDWKSSISILSNTDVKVVEVMTNEFILNTVMFPGKSMNENDPKNKDRVRLNNYKITSNGKLRVTFQKTKYAHYLNSNEHLDEPYLNQERTNRDVLLKQIKRGDIGDFPLTNICGAGLFSITNDNNIIISKHSATSKVYPNIYTFTTSGVLNWVDNCSNANPFNGILEIYKVKIGFDANVEEIKMIGFGADARKLYFQFSFFEQSKYSFTDFQRSQSIRNIALRKDERRELIAIPFKIENVIELLFTEIWEPAAEVAILTLCVNKFGRKKVLELMKLWEEHWPERNTRNEFEYRCLSREGHLADLTANIPLSELDTISKKNIDEIRSFIGQENIAEKTILEIGCGTGRITKELLNLRPAEIYCIEVSPCMMKKHEKIKDPDGLKIFRINKYFQFWEPEKKHAKFQIAICSLFLIHNKEIEPIIKKLCSLITEKVFVIEDITDLTARNRPISQYTFLRKKDDLINAFIKYGGILENSCESTLYKDNLIFLEFKISHRKTKL